MSRIATDSVKPVDREQLRQELLKLIVKNEQQRRDERKVSDK